MDDADSVSFESKSNYCWGAYSIWAKTCYFAHVFLITTMSSVNQSKEELSLSLLKHTVKVLQYRSDLDSWYKCLVTVIIINFALILTILTLIWNTLYINISNITHKFAFNIYQDPGLWQMKSCCEIKVELWSKRNNTEWKTTWLRDSCRNILWMFLQAGRIWRPVRCQRILNINDLQK